MRTRIETLRATPPAKLTWGAIRRLMPLLPPDEGWPRVPFAPPPRETEPASPVNCGVVKAGLKGFDPFE